MNAVTVDILHATVVAMDAANAGEYNHFDFVALNCELQLELHIQLIQTKSENKCSGIFTDFYFHTDFCFFYRAIWRA